MSLVKNQNLVIESAIRLNLTSPRCGLTLEALHHFGQVLADDELRHADVVAVVVQDGDELYHAQGVAALLEEGPEISAKWESFFCLV